MASFFYVKCQKFNYNRLYVKIIRVIPVVSDYEQIVNLIHTIHNILKNSAKYGIMCTTYGTAHM